MATVQDLAVPIILWFVIPSLVYIFLRLLFIVLLPVGGLYTLQTQIELLLCRDREGSRALMVSATEVVLFYVIGALFPVMSVVLMVGFILQLMAMLSSVNGTERTLFHEVAAGNGLSIAALACFAGTLCVFLNALYMSIRVVSKLANQKFREVLKDHFKQKKKNQEDKKQEKEELTKKLTKKLSNNKIAPTLSGVNATPPLTQLASLPTGA